MKIVKCILEAVFNVVYPILSPNVVQKGLKFIGFRFPFVRFAEKMRYTGLVKFSVNGKNFVLKSHNNFIDSSIFWYGIFGVWEPTQLRLWASLVKDNDVILDIGANTGVYSIISTCNPLAKIYSFEPVPAVHEMLVKNITLNNAFGIEVHEMLVGEGDGEETLYIPRAGWIDVASMDKNFAQKFVKKEKMQMLKRSMTSIDSFLKALNLNQNAKILCKIDVEGAEQRVLLGMLVSLQERNMSFMIELLDGAAFSNLVALLPSKYVIYAIDERAKKIQKTDVFINTAYNYYITDSVINFE